VGLTEIARHPDLLSGWQQRLLTQHSSPLLMIGIALITFPKIALGLSGFETGVAVMPLVRGYMGEKQGNPAGRIRNTQRLLLTAALIMSVLLMGSSIVTTVLIEPAKFQSGGEANGRALAYLGHHYLGDAFGTAYDLSTIGILWFAGAAAMAGMLNLVSRYVPRYGMGPEWARASRPLVLAFTAVACGVTIVFDADVDAQGGAYATGVLVLMTSAAVAVTISAWNKKTKWLFLAICCVFVFTTIANIIERPEGIKIASFFIALAIFMSLAYRALRATELRITQVVLDEAAQSILLSDKDACIRLIAHYPGNRTPDEYVRKELRAREAFHLDGDEDLLFLEIEPTDASEFDAHVQVTGMSIDGHKILRARSPAVPNAVAAILIHVAKFTGKLPYVYFRWTEGNPVGLLLRYLFLGEGDLAPVTREVLRRRIRDPRKRPHVHVG
jgi:hypothetical protein